MGERANQQQQSSADLRKHRHDTRAQHVFCWQPIIVRCRRRRFGKRQRLNKALEGAEIKARRTGRGWEKVNKREDEGGGLPRIVAIKQHKMASRSAINILNPYVRVQTHNSPISDHLDVDLTQSRPKCALFGADHTALGAIASKTNSLFDTRILSPTPSTCFIQQHRAGGRTPPPC
jgi:hypothetical protein